LPLLHAAELVEEIRGAGDFGVLVGAPEVDAGKVLSYKDAVVTKLYKGLQGVLKARKVDVVHGRGRLAGPGAVEVDGATITAPAVVLASGSRARSLPFAAIDGRAFISSDEALTLAEVPSSVVVIGAGAVGLEFASLWRSFGADVTVVEALPRLAPGEDEEVSKEVERQFRKRGISSHVGAKVVRAAAGEAGATVELETASGQAVTLEAERCLVAIGRAAVSEDLGYVESGVTLERGFVVVDEWCRTGVEGIWAVGDLVAQPSLGSRSRTSSLPTSRSPRASTSPSRWPGTRRRPRSTTWASPAAPTPTPRSPRSASPSGRRRTRATRSRSPGSRGPPPARPRSSVSPAAS
jgi:dihydrolipoamide dehydrogenase